MNSKVIPTSFQGKAAENFGFEKKPLGRKETIKIK